MNDQYSLTQPCHPVAQLGYLSSPEDNVGRSYQAKSVGHREDRPRYG